MIASFKTSAAILLTALTLAFVYSIASFALRVLPDIDMLDAIGLGFAFGLCILLGQSIVCLIFAALAFAAAPLFLLTPLVLGVVSLARGFLTPSKRTSERARIDQLYPHPEPYRLRRHA